MCVFLSGKGDRFSHKYLWCKFDLNLTVTQDIECYAKEQGLICIGRIPYHQQNGIKVITGVSAGEPEELVQSYLDDTLVTGANVCDH